MSVERRSLRQRLGATLRALGPADTAWFAVDRVLQRLSFGTARLVKYYFVAQPVAGATAGAARPAGGTRLYVADDIDDTIRQAPRPEPTLRSRFDQQARCVVAERDGELAGFVWWCPTAYHEDTVRCVYRWSPASSARWDFDVYVAPPFRMGRLFARLWERTHALLAAEEVAWTLSRIDAFNPGSLAAHRKLGARQIARGWFLVVGRLQLSIATVAPYIHVSLHDGSVPALVFDLSSLAASERERT
jgi:hypothetical protein